MPSPEMGGWLLGVDGGGTKTHFSLAKADGTIVACHRGPASYHVDIGIAGVETVLREGVAAVLAEAGAAPTQVSAAYFGLPAYDEHPAADAELALLPRAILGHERYQCGNDMVCAWAGALGGEDGINIVAGTGSIGYGERAGRSARCGGWGELFGDEGSAHWLAIRGLGLFAKMSDGRLPRGPLHRGFRDTLGLTGDMEVLDRYVDGDRSRTTIAALAPIVARAAQEGDVHAAEALREAAEELAAHAASIARALGYGAGDTVATSYSGGMFAMGSHFTDLFRTALASVDPRLTLVEPRGSPQQGAVALAARLLRQGN